MRVFTHRIVKNLAIGETPNNCWSLPQRGIYSFVDEVNDQINELYPGKAPQGAHPLDYTIILDPQFYIVGRYWGDETTLEAASHFNELRNSNYGYQSLSIYSDVITCDDSAHPTQFSIEQLNLRNMFLQDNYKIAGYYLASDPDNFVSLA